MGQQARPPASSHQPRGTVPGVPPLTTSGKKPQARGGHWTSALPLPCLVGWPGMTLVCRRNHCRRSLGPLAVTVPRPGSKAHSYCSVNDSNQLFLGTKESEEVGGPGRGSRPEQSGRLGAPERPRLDPKPCSRILLSDLDTFLQASVSLGRANRGVGCASSQRGTPRVLLLGQLLPGSPAVWA